MPDRPGEAGSEQPAGAADAGGHLQPLHGGGQVRQDSTFPGEYNNIYFYLFIYFTCRDLSLETDELSFYQATNYKLIFTSNNVDVS